MAELTLPIQESEKMDTPRRETAEASVETWREDMLLKPQRREVQRGRRSSRALE